MISAVMENLMASDPVVWLLTGVTILFAYLWGHRDGARCQLAIMNNHCKNGMSFKGALEYEEAVHEGKVPRG